jgi:Dolichyl-phosphate-mannose-protein mannosyltransferase
MENSKTERRLWLILLLPIALAVLNLRYLWIQCFNPSDTSNPESMVVFFAERVANGDGIFLDFHKPPYILIQYTPFYHWMLGQTARLFGFSREGIFISGRIFVFGCALLIGLLLYLRGRSEEEGVPAAASGALFFLSSYVLWPWAATNRPDVPGVLLSLAGFILYTQFRKSGLRWLSIPLFVLAIFTKQFFISAPIAIFLWLILEKKTKEAFLLAGSCALIVVAILFALDRSTDGLSTMNLIDPNSAAPFGWQNLRLVTLAFFQISPLPLMLAAAGAVHKGWRRPETIYFGVSLAFAILASSKLGSNMNYFIEPLAASCLLVPAGLRSMIDLFRGPRSAFLIAAFVVLLIPAINFMGHTLANLKFPNENAIQQQVTAAKGLIITDNPRFALISRQPFMLEPFPLSYMERAGKWDSSRITEMLRDHQIEMAVLTLPVENALGWQGFKRLPASVLGAIEKYYRLDRTIDGYYVYLPQ